jgi:hypothetical protein
MTCRGWPDRDGMRTGLESARLFLLLLLLAGCAAPDPHTDRLPAARPPSVVVSGNTVEVHLPPDREIVTESVGATPRVAWEALFKAYEDMGIEVREVNEDALTLGNPRFVVSRRLAGVPLSRHLECGMGLLGYFADIYRIEMKILSSIVQEGPDAVQVRTYVEAVARNPEGTGGGPIQCSSTRRLEREIAGRVRFHAGGEQPPFQAPPDENPWGRPAP